MKMLAIIFVMLLLVGCKAPGDEKVYGELDWDFIRNEADTATAGDKDATITDYPSDGDIVGPENDDMEEDADEVTTDEGSDTAVDEGGGDGAQTDVDTVFGDSYVIQWGTFDFDTGRGVALLENGQFYVTGDTNGTLSDDLSPGGYDDAFLSRHDADGSILWLIQWGTEEIEVGRGVTVDGNGAVYVTGETYGDLAGGTMNTSQDCFLTKVSSAGSIVWTKQYGTGDSDEGGTAVTIGTDGAILVAGYTNALLQGYDAGRDAVLLKYDSAGNVSKEVRWGTDAKDEASAVAVAADGSIYVAGDTEGDLDGETNHGMMDVFLIKFTNDGTRVWTRLVGTSTAEAYATVATAGDGSVYVTGATYGDFVGNDSGDLNAFLAKFTSESVISWVQRWGSSSSEENTQVAVNGDGDIFVAGETFGSVDRKENKGADDIFITQWHPDGTQGTTLMVGTDTNEHVFGMGIGADDAVYVTGETYGDLGGANAGGFDIYVALFPKSKF